MDGQNDLWKKAAQMKQGLDAASTVHLREGKLRVGLSCVSVQRGGNQRASLSLALRLEMSESRENNSSAYAAALGHGVGWGRGEEGRVSSSGPGMVEVKSITRKR